jgi:amidase
VDDLAFCSAVELAARIRRRELGCRELLDHYIARGERWNGAVNAIVTLDVERARREADALDRAAARGEVRGPLHGVPMTVKDTFETAGMRTTAGAPKLAEHVPAADATAVARLRAAGAVVFGKTNTPPFATDAQTYNPLFGTTRNPWDPARSPGGSSGGSAAAIAAGLTALELGSDLGGSIRNPAHYCGVYGHKTSYGLVPLGGHVPGPPGTVAEPDLTVVGPIARHADDLEAALGVIAGADDADAVAWKLDLPLPRRASLRDYRVAAWLDDPACAVDAELLAAFDAAVGALRRAGAAVDERARPVDDLADVHRHYQRLAWPILAGGMHPDSFAELARAADGAAADDASLEVAYARGVTARHRDWLAVAEWRALYRRRWAEFFRGFDVLLCPIVPTTALLHDHGMPASERTIRVNGRERRYWDQMIWAGAITAAYLPATVAPIGRTRAGLPVGLQIVAPYLEDRTAIDFATRLADVVGGFEPPPGF